MSDARLQCAHCRVENRFGAKYCTFCAKPLVDGRVDGRTQVDESGFVVDGQWHREPGEFFRRFSVDDMGSRFGRKELRVPRGCRLVVDGDGKVLEVRLGGTRLVIGWWKRLAGLFGAGTNGANQLSFYLADARPLPFRYVRDVTLTENAASVKVEINVSANVRGLRPPVKEGALTGVEKVEREALECFLNTLVGDSDSVAARTIHDRLAPEVTRVVERHMDTNALRSAHGLDAAEAAMRKALQTDVGDALGLAMTVQVQVAGTTVAFDLSLGGAPIPSTKACVSCGAELQRSKKFCTRCAEPQPAPTRTRVCSSCGMAVPPEKKFCTSCGEPFAQRTEVRAPVHSSDGQTLQLDVVIRARGKAPADAQARMEAVASNVFARLARQKTSEQLASVEGFRAMESALTEEARRALAALSLKLTDLTVLDLRSGEQEWLLGARAELEQARQEALVGREWLDVDKESFDVRALTLDLALQTERMERDSRFTRYADEVADQERRQELQDREANMQARGAERDADTELAIDAARRRKDRGVGAADHEDALAEKERAGELRAVDKATDHAELDHEMSVENKVAAHDIHLTRTAMDLESEKGRRAVDDQVYATRTVADAKLDVRAREEAHELSLEERRQKARVDLKAREQDLELTAEERRQKGQMDKLRAMAEMDAQIRQDELHEQAQEQAHERGMREQLKGLSAEQMLAMQAGGEQSPAITAALAEKFKADAASNTAMSAQQKEMYDRMLEQQQGSQAQMLELMKQAQGNIVDLSKSALGAQKTAQAEVQQAHERSAERSSAEEHAMGTMADVASAAAGKGGHKCHGCGTRSDEGDRVCGECGKKL